MGTKTKGRGRPPKTEKPVIDDDIDEEEPVASGSPKKGRGRPKKVSKLDDIDEEEPILKKKKAPPKKVAPTPVTDSEDYSEDFKDAGEKEDSDDVEWGKKP